MSMVTCFPLGPCYALRSALQGAHSTGRWNTDVDVELAGEYRDMQQWQYKVAFVDYRGRISVEGQEQLIQQERRTAFVRAFLDSLGTEGWELVSVQPVEPQSAYYVFKRPIASGAS